nr:MAG TPA: hypothetical protein [Caudoviricetes sp.]
MGYVGQKNHEKHRIIPPPPPNLYPRNESISYKCNVRAYVRTFYNMQFFNKPLFCPFRLDRCKW